MKKVIITSVMLCYILILSAQSNLPIVDPAKKWTYMFYLFEPPWITYFDSYYTRFGGDTIINQIDYLKIWESGDDPPEIWNLKGFAREDTNGKVYFRSNNNDEGLAYRFDITVGDTFTMNNPFHGISFTAEVLEDDSVFIEPLNEKRRRLKLEEYDPVWTYEEYWIEGLGSMAGIVYSGEHMIPFTGGYLTALCSWYNNSVVYSNPEFNSCFITVSTQDIQEEKNDLIIQPNPLVCQSFVSYDDINRTDLILEIRDILGNLILTTHYGNAKKIILYRSQFQSGIYIVSLLDENNILARKKLIVN
jgi:hypothetical protein